MVGIFWLHHENGKWKVSKNCIRGDNPWNKTKWNTQNEMFGLPISRLQNKTHPLYLRRKPSGLPQKYLASHCETEAITQPVCVDDLVQGRSFSKFSYFSVFVFHSIYSLFHPWWVPQWLKARNKQCLKSCCATFTAVFISLKHIYSRLTRTRSVVVIQETSARMNKTGFFVFVILFLFLFLSLFFYYVWKWS